MTTEINRRDLLRSLSLAVIAAPLALPAPQPGAPLYFSKDEFELLDCLTELIIPADDHSPGAHAAGVAPFIDKTTAEAYVPEDRESWRKGLALVNKLSQEMNGKRFVEASASQQTAVLTKMSAEAKDEKSESGKFFGQLKLTTAFAYYSSSIGIHQEMEYRGNVLLPQFAGYLPSDPLPPLSSL